MYRSALSFILRIEFPDPVSNTQYLASLRIVHHHCELPTKPYFKRSEILTIALSN